MMNTNCQPIDKKSIHDLSKAIMTLYADICRIRIQIWFLLWNW